MKGSFTATAGGLASAVKYAAQWLDPRPTVPIWGGLRFDVTGGRLNVAGFNENTTGRAAVTVEGDADGSFVVAGRLIAALVETFPNKPVTFEAEDAAIVITAPRFRATLPAMAVKDWPRQPDQAATIGTAMGADLADVVRRVGAAATTDLAKPAYTGIHLVFGDTCIMMQASDGYRAARQELAWTAGENAVTGQTVLVPASALTDGVDGFVGPDAVEIGLDGGMFSLSTPDRSLVARALDDRSGGFPAAGLAQIFAYQTTASFTVRMADLAQPLKRAARIDGGSDPRVSLALRPGLLILSAGGERGNGDEEIDVEYDGPDTMIYVKSATLHSAMAGAPGDTAVLHFTPSTTKPIIVTAPAEPTWRYMLAPLRNLRAA